MLDLDQQPAADLPVFSRLETASVDQVSIETIARTRKNHALILQSMGAVGQGVVAEGLGVNDSQISRWKESGSIERTAKMLAILGLKVVPVDAVVYLEFKG